MLDIRASQERLLSGGFEGIWTNRRYEWDGEGFPALIEFFSPESLANMRGKVEPREVPVEGAVSG